MIVAGEKSALAFVLHEPKDHFFIREIEIWIEGNQLATSGCWLPSFLQELQGFANRSEKFDSPAMMEFISSVSSEAMFQRIDEILSHRGGCNDELSREALSAHDMSVLDEATDYYEIYVFDANERQKKFFWRGLDVPQCYTEHRGVSHANVVGRSDVRHAIEEAFRAFSASIEFSDREWSQWTSDHN